MVVADASVLIAAAVDSGSTGTWAEQIVAHHSLAAPHLVWAEAANILRRLERAGQLTPIESASSYQDLLRLTIDVFPFEPFAERIWMLRNNLSSYDAWYVALAEGLDVPLATLDQRLARASGPLCSFLLGR